MSANDLLVNTLNLVYEVFARYISIILFGFGFIGLTLNTLVFTRKALRQNSCTRYFLASTIANYLVVYFILPSRILSDGFNVDPGTYSLGYCKFRFYIYFTFKSLSSWFIVLASIDRFMCSSRSFKCRQFSRLSVARNTIVITTIICLLFYSHILIFYDNRNGICDSLKGIYQIFNDVCYLVGYSVIPPILMSLFGVLTIYNVRRLRLVAPKTKGSRVVVITNKNQQLALMLLFQVIFISLTSVPHATQKLYKTLTSSFVKSDLLRAQENLYAEIARVISFVNHTCSFYILTLSSKTFRTELVKLFEETKRYFTMPRNTTVICIPLKSIQRKRTTTHHQVVYSAEIVSDYYFRPSPCLGSRILTRSEENV
ncbi:unnamed protein product [Didymodactylos carnosus]|uniref:G-protein coupled receptors family 1 profile domain-containing protein n=1 Tax=Didymodactylos carnosus TaxID=1234261 RepID=A0A815Q397_9BILA|nr:unnamed protein product [Didymodactylos carnosus]CAF1456719.1 unnamed protein product [Didymodactylos carnosus]CAF4214577.1 unnamed protein product [Didymodactylos carnosus]CAF4328351.1 unnamed protein product [Didymodactylos carnosus]